VLAPSGSSLSLKADTTSQQIPRALLYPAEGGMAARSRVVYWAAQVLSQTSSPEGASTAVFTPRDWASTTPFPSWKALEGLAQSLEIFAEERIPIVESSDIASPKTSPSPMGHRTRELEWKRSHQEELLRYADQWVALEGEMIIAHGREPLEVIAESRSKGIMVPYIFFVETTHGEIFKIGL